MALLIFTTLGGRPYYPPMGRLRARELKGVSKDTKPGLPKLMLEMITFLCARSDSRSQFTYAVLAQILTVLFHCPKCLILGNILHDCPT